MLQNELLKVLKEIFTNKVEQYGTKKEAVESFHRGDFNCCYGGISELIYYHQTIGLFKRYPVETMELLEYIGDELGEPVHEVSSTGTEHRINYYIWYIFEYFCYFWIQDLEYEVEEEEEEE